jgi:hypothetical protein
LGPDPHTTVLFLTDLHIGSQWGLWYPKESCNSIQTKLFEHWTDFCKRLTKISPDLIFLLGDIIDPSPRRRNRSKANELTEQLDCALSLLHMIPRKKRSSTVGLIGSGRFDQEYLECNQRLCLAFGGKFYGRTAIFNFSGHNFRAYHGSTTAYIYLELVMGRRRTFAQEAIARKTLPEIEGIVCGHSHRWLHMRTMWRDGKDFHVVLCPGWEGQTESMIMKDPDKMIPEIGAVVGDFSRETVDFQCFRYPTPLGVSKPVSGKFA